jgi:hypothetical protein
MTYGIGLSGSFFSATIFFFSAFLWHADDVLAQEMLTLTFAQGATEKGASYSTAPAGRVPVISVQNGQQVIWRESRGRDYQLRSSQQSWGWTQIQEVDRQSTYIAVTPRREGDRITVEVEYFRRDGSQGTHLSSTVTGKAGEWIPLLQPNAGPDAGSRQVYQAGDSTHSMSLKVEPGN